MRWKRRIALFLFAQTVSLLGSSLVQYAIIWYITINTSSGLMLSISTVCGFLPQILVSPFAGVWADRYNRKSLIMISDSLIAVSTLIIALLFLNGIREIWLLFLVLGVRSFFTGIQMPAVNAIIPQLTPKKHLLKINGINNSVNSLMMIASPALSGLIMNYAKIEAIFFIDVITAIIGIGIMFFIPVKTIVKRIKKTSLKADIKEGIDYIRSNGFLKQLLIFELVIIVLVSPAAFLTPLMVARTFGPEIWRLTLTEITFSGGALLGGIIIVYWSGFKNKIYTALLACLLYGTSMIAFGISYNFVIYLIVNTIAGIGMPLYTTPMTTIIQEKTAAEVHGRIFSYLQIATSCALPLGMVLFGPLGDIVSIQSILIGCGVSILAVSAYFYSNKRFINDLAD